MSHARPPRIVLAVLAALLFVPLLHAAVTSTTGSIFGVVTDTSGAPLPGVTVTVTSPNLQGPRSAISNEKGEYNVELLPPGTYHVEFALQGMDTQMRNGVAVNLNQTTKLNASVGVSKVSESITVTADTVVIDPTQTQAQQNFKQDYLKYATIGQNNRDYLAVINQAGGAYDNNTGNPNIMGANLGENQFRLDGLNTTDPVTHTFGTNLAFDAIQEIAVQTAGYEAEYGKATGGVVNVITKSGGNSFSGSLDARLQNQHMSEKGHRRRDFPVGTNELAFDRSEQQFRTFEPATTLGGPVAKDKLWFFLAAERPLNEFQPPALYGFKPGRRDFNGWGIFGKLTATLNANQTGSFKYTYNNGDIPFSEASSFYQPEAGTDQYQSTRIYNASYDAVLSPIWLLNLQAGVTRALLTDSPMSGDLTTPGVLDVATGIYSQNAIAVQSSNRNRNELLGSTTFFFTGAGTHQVKAGLDADQTTFRAVFNVTGTPPDPSWCSQAYGQPAGATCNAYQVTYSGFDYLWYVTTHEAPQTYKGTSQAYFVQDEWRPVERLTVKAGLRYDGLNYKNDNGSQHVQLNKIQPRIGFAYDVFNNANTVVHGHYGQFMSDLGLSLASYLSSKAAVTDIFLSNGTGYDFYTAFGGASGNTVDPSLKPTYADEYNFGFTQRLPWNSSLDVTGVYRKTNDIIEDSCLADNCNSDFVFWLTNRPNGMNNVLRSNYQGIITKLEMRPTGWANILASYTWSKSRGSIEYTQNQSSDFDIYPDLFVNRYGYLSDDARNRLKLAGYVRLPMNFILGANYYADSGTPYNVTQSDLLEGVVFLEPRGSRRLPHNSQLDLQLQKNFTLHGTTLGLIASVFNVFDHETVLGRNSDVGGTYNPGDPVVVPSTPENPAFNTATAWQQPRRYELGFRVEF